MVVVVSMHVCICVVCVLAYAHAGCVEEEHFSVWVCVEARN